MNIKLILLLSIGFLSCNHKTDEGLWLVFEEDQNNYGILDIQKDSLSVQQIMNWNYWMFKTQLKLPRVSPNEFKDDNLTIKINTAKDEISFYRKDTLNITFKAAKLIQHSPNISIEELNNRISKKQISYEIGNIQFDINTIQDDISINTSDTINKHRITNYDIFQIGSEIFLIPETDNPIPIQIQNLKTTKLSGMAFLGYQTENIRASIKPLPIQHSTLNGVWEIKSEDINKGIPIIQFEFQENQLIEKTIYRLDTMTTQLLSDSITLVAMPKNEAAFELKIESIKINEIKLIDYRGNKRIYPKLNFHRIK